MIRQDINELMKKTRLEKNLTLEQAGKLLGVSKTTYRDYENGVLKVENMKIDKLIPLSIYLNMFPNELFNIGNDKFNILINKEQFAEFVQIVLNKYVYDMNDDDRKYLEKTIQLICE